MRIDPTVARRKFAREVERIEGQRAVLRGWGCWVERATYPFVDAVFLPRKTLRLALPTDPRRNQGLIVLARPEPQFVTLDVPGVAGRAFGVRVELRDFDRCAPSVSFHDPFTWEPLPFGLLPLGHHVDEHGKASQVVMEMHPGTKAPFLCMRGVREYHEHPQHTGDEWALYRGHYGLFTVLSTLCRTCVDHARPRVVLTPRGAPEIRWDAEEVA